jgi:hypothetical protein
VVIELYERDADAEMADAIEEVLEAELRDGVWRYLIRWRDSDQSHDSWQTEATLGLPHSHTALGAARARSAMLSFDEDDDTTPSRESPPLGSGLWLPPSPHSDVEPAAKPKPTKPPPKPPARPPQAAKAAAPAAKPTAAAKPTVAAKTWAAVAGRADAVPPYAPPEGKASKFAVGATQTGIDGRPWVVRAVPNDAFKSEWWPYDPVQRQPLSLSKVPKPVKEAKAKRPKEAKAKMPKPSEVEMAGGSAGVDGPGGPPRPHPPPGWAFPTDGQDIEVEVEGDDGPAVWCTATVCMVLIDGWFKAKIQLPGKRHTHKPSSLPPSLPPSHSHRTKP